MPRTAVFCLCVFLMAMSSQGTQAPQIDQGRIETPALDVDINYGKLPLYFIPNAGQVDEKALFYADTSRYTLWLTRNGLVFDSTRSTDQPHVFERDVSRLEFIDPNPYTAIIPEDRAAYRVSYFNQKDKADWRAGIETSRAVLYADLYPDIDLRIYGVEKEIEYDFIVRPGGDTRDIGFEYRDVQGTRLDTSGNLIIETEFGEMRHTRPVAFQEIDGRRVAVEARFANIGENAYGFRVGEYDRSRDLIIDPLVIVYATYIGGSNGEGSTYVAVDSTGAAYLTSWINSKTFPTKNPLFPKFSGVTDSCVTKVSPEGNALVYSTYLGGIERDGGLDIAVDDAGAAYVTGVAREGFPTQNALYEYQGMADAFITKVDPTGTALVYSTCFGGSDWDRSHGIAVDAKGNAYICGITWSTDMPTRRAFQKKNSGNGEAFVAKIDPTGSKLIFATYLGGSGQETAIDLTIDDQGHVYIVGDTTSPDFPRLKAFQKKFAGETDTFVMKLDKKGKKLLYSTYLGGSSTDNLRAVDIDVWGNAYVIGQTASPDFPLRNALYDTLAGDIDVFITKLNPKGKKLLFSTFLGGKKVDYGQNLIVDLDQTIYIGAYTESKNFPTKDALFKKYSGEGDRILAQLSQDGQSLLFSTYFGGAKWERGYGLALDYMGGIYIGTATESKDMPVKNAFQKKLRGSSDMYLVKLIKE